MGRIDERNLSFCLSLNLNYTTITQLDTTYFIAMIKLSLIGAKITSLKTITMTNLEFLDF